MPKTTKRKCKKCGKEIIIKRDNVCGVVYYGNYYYHTDCLVEHANEKLQNKRSVTKKWQSVLDDIQQLELTTKEMLRKQMFSIRDTDALNEYLLEKYNLTTIDTRFWQTVRELGNGFYRKKRCKKIDIETLYGAWKWGQHKLDEINKFNKMNNRGPTDNATRLMYDLTIIVQKIPNYLAYKAKLEAAAAEEKSKIRENINYNNFERKAEVNGMDDISDMLDEFF